MKIWRGRVLWRVYVHPHTHPHTQLKKSGIPHTHTHTQSMRGFPVKTGTGSGNTHGDEFICHLYCWALKIHFVDILNIFLIYLKTSKLVIINILWRYNRETTQTKNSTKNPNSNISHEFIIFEAHIHNFPKIV